MSGKTVFLDRDGVINVKAPEGDYIRNWKQFVFLPHAIQAIKALKDHGYTVIVITNQRGVARHLMTMGDVNEIHNYMQSMLEKHGTKVDAVYVCPHEKGTCHCRKPEIGLFLQAEKDFPIDRNKSWMIGDSLSDIQAGKNYKVRTIAIGNDLMDADYVSKALLQAVNEVILPEDK